MMKERYLALTQSATAIEVVLELPLLSSTTTGVNATASKGTTSGSWLVLRELQLLQHQPRNQNGGTGSSVTRRRSCVGQALGIIE